MAQGSTNVILLTHTDSQRRALSRIQFSDLHVVTIPLIAFRREAQHENFTSQLSERRKPFFLLFLHHTKNPHLLDINGSPETRRTSRALAKTSLKSQMLLLNVQMVVVMIVVRRGEQIRRARLARQQLRHELDVGYCESKRLDAR